MGGTTASLAIVTVCGLFIAWHVGAHDLANAMATSLRLQARHLRLVFGLAIVGQLVGSIWFGDAVTETIRRGIVDPQAFAGQVDAWVAVMVSASLAAVFWLAVAGRHGVEVSTTQALIGGLVGAGIAYGGMEALHWPNLARIAVGWVASPLLAALLAYLLFLWIRRWVLQAQHPERVLRRSAPCLVFAAVWLVSGSLAAAMWSALASWPLWRRLLRTNASSDHAFSPQHIERAFAALQWMTVVYLALAVASNDVSNAVGPMSAVHAALSHGLDAAVATPLNLLAIGAFGIALGLGMYGYRLLAIVAQQLPALTPSRGFAAEFAGATTILLASHQGLPISTSHTLLGAVLGVGLARGLAALNLRVLSDVFAGWLITVPSVALMAALMVFCWRFLLH